MEEERDGERGRGRERVKRGGCGRRGREWEGGRGKRRESVWRGRGGRERECSSRCTHLVRLLHHDSLAFQPLHQLVHVNESLSVAVDVVAELGQRLLEQLDAAMATLHHVPLQHGPLVTLTRVPRRHLVGDAGNARQPRLHLLLEARWPRRRRQHRLA